MYIEKTDTPHTLKVGDILSCSWGYDQTNVNFYQVVGATDKSVRIRGIQSHLEQTGPMCGQSVPIKDKFTDHSFFNGTKLFRVIRHLYKFAPNETELHEYVKIRSFAYAYKWSGKPEYTSWYA